MPTVNYSLWRNCICYKTSNTVYEEIFKERQTQIIHCTQYDIFHHLLDNNVKLTVCTGGNSHGLYRYLKIIGAPTIFTTSGQRYHHFCPSSSINNDTETLQSVISDLCMRQKIIRGFCGRIGHKADAYIIRGPKFLPPILRINMNPFNVLRGDEPNEPPIEWNSQPSEAHFKYRTSPPKTSPVVSSIMGRLNHHVIDNGDVEVHHSEFLVGYSSEPVLDPDTTPTKSIDDD